MTPHDIWNETATEQLRRLRAVNSAMLDSFPHIPVFLSLGNHDTYPVDSFSTHAIDWIHHDDFAWLRDGLADAWRLPASALATVRQVIIFFLFSFGFDCLYLFIYFLK